MKESRVSMQMRVPPKPPQPKSNISSLKAIMRRVPLSQYINQRPPKSNHNQPLSYFDKLKAMLHREQLSSQRHLDGSEGQNEAMDIEQQNSGMKAYLNQYQHSPLVSPYRPIIEKSVNKYKERSHSNQNKSKPKHSSTYSNINRPSLVKRPQTHNDMVVGDIITTITEGGEKDGFVSMATKAGKTMKKECVNYKKFDNIFASGEWEAGIVELQEVLGCGASATVRVGRDRKSSRVFAVKVYEKYKLVQVSRKKRVLQEIEILSRLKHPNIIEMIHCCQDKRQIHLILQLVPQAETLQDFIRRYSYDVPNDIKRLVAVQVIEALCYLHSMGVAHRDIKTDNVILGSGSVLKLIDFGFATTVVRGQSHCGTPNYMAPQLFEKKGVYDPLKVDVWALGILLYYLHEGCYPFKGYNEKELARSIRLGQFSFKKSDPSVLKVIEAALKVDPTMRSDSHHLLMLMTTTK